MGSRKQVASGAAHRKGRNLQVVGCEIPDREKMDPTRIKKFKSRGVECPDREKMGPTRIKKFKSRGTRGPGIR